MDREQMLMAIVLLMAFVMFYALTIALQSIDAANMYKEAYYQCMNTSKMMWLG